MKKVLFLFYFIITIYLFLVNIYSIYTLLFNITFLFFVISIFNDKEHKREEYHNIKNKLDNKNNEIEKEDIIIEKEQKKYEIVAHKEMIINISAITSFINYIFQFENIDELKNFICIEIKNIFKCEKVNFNLVNKNENIIFYDEFGIIKYEKIYSDKKISIPIFSVKKLTAIIECINIDNYFYGKMQLGIIMLLSHNIGKALSIIIARKELECIENENNCNCDNIEIISSKIKNLVKEDIFYDLVSESIQIIPSQTAIIFILNNNNELKPCAIVGENVESYRDFSFLAEGNIIGNVLKEEQPIVYNSSFFKNPELVNSVLAYPFKFKDNVSGVLVLFNKKSGIYEQIDLRAISFLISNMLNTSDKIEKFKEEKKNIVFSNIIKDLAKLIKVQKDNNNISEKIVQYMKLFWDLDDLIIGFFQPIDNKIVIYGAKEAETEIKNIFLKDKFSLKDVLRSVELSSETKKRLRKLSFMSLKFSKDILGFVFYKGNISEKNELFIMKDISLMFIQIMISKEISEHLKKVDRLAALGEMSAGVAHEIRNPLGGIELFASYLKNSLDKDTKNYSIVCDIIDAVKSLNKIVTDLLTYARPAKASKIDIKLSELADTSIHFIEDKLKNNNITIIRDYSKELHTVFVDMNQIKQTLINILLNAVDTTKENKKIYVNVESFKENVKITIKDNGNGLSEEDEKKIFSPFYTTKDSGTGLGLVISQRFIEENNGTFILRNREDEKGAEAIVSFIKSKEIPI